MRAPDSTRNVSFLSLCAPAPLRDIFKPIKRVVALCVIVVGVTITSNLSAADKPPNILWLSVEDMSPHLGCYGDEHARTPNIDAFAKQGVLYENAFVCAPVCAPCRSSIITGVYPTTLGTHNMRCRITLPDAIKCFPKYLRGVGYYCTNNAKTDYQFKPPKTAWDASSDEAHWKNRPNKDQPFFAVFNYTGTHESRVRGDQPAYDNAVASLAPEEFHDPASLTLPPYYPDTPAVREDWARYYNCVTAMDKWIAEKLAELDETGVADDTIVFFWSDHGVGLPRGKRWLYDSGIHVPLIVRIPEKFRRAGQGAPGTRTDELVSLIDLPPTVLKLAGVEIPKYMQGRAFLGEDLSPEREYVYAARDRMDERYDMIRAVRDKRYKYIRNYQPWKPYAQWLSYGERNAVMKELRRLNSSGDLSEACAAFMSESKPRVELYDLDADPNELNNLAEEPSHARTLQIMKERILKEMFRQGDAGVFPEGISADDFVAGQAVLVGVDDEKQWTNCFAAREYAFDPTVVNDSDLLAAVFAQMRFTDSATVRFWAVTTVGQLDPGLLDTPNERSASIHSLLMDDSPTIRVAAAEWLCRLGDASKGLPVLIKELENENRWVRLQAANAIDLLGEDARPAIPALKKAKARSIAEAKGDALDKYVARVTNHTLNVLEGTNDEVQ